MQQKLLLISLVFIIFGYGCKDDQSTTIATPAYLKAIVPYVQGQTFKYKASGGGIINVTMNVSSHFQSQAACSGCEETVVEKVRYSFNTNGGLMVEMNIDNRPIIFMTIWSPTENLQLGTGFDLMTANGTATLLCNTGNQVCLPSVTLNGRTFTDVIELTNGNQPDKITRAYYNLQQGLVGFVYGNGLTYRLED
ncbi:MAG: hypothetical protein H7Y86_07105 [Rhizobacter sp.]|nr:hypothetical protein [Ferruginibacter sp.]